MRILFLIVCFICFSLFGYSQADINTNTNNDTILFPPDFFDQTEPLELTLEFDIKKFSSEKSDSVYLQANLSYFINEIEKIEKTARIKPRGEYRRNHCFFSPFWLNIKKADLNNDYLSNVNKIKVVSHCRDSKTYSDFLIKEYLAYKIFNIITDYSFKVRLLKITYIDTGRKNKITTNWAFMIEPEDMLADRLKAYKLKIDKINYNQTDTMLTTVMSIFQYMIGNTDYSVAGRHNIKLLTLKDYTKPSLIPVPYDFDFSGLVNTHYARPQPSLGTESVTERYFYGMCRSDQLYNQVLNLFAEKKDEIFILIESFEHIDKKSRKYVLNYLEDFYIEIENPRFVKNHLRSTCE